MQTAVKTSPTALQGHPSRTNAVCAACNFAVNGINGCWCTMLREGVEYTPQPPCQLSDDLPEKTR